MQTTAMTDPYNIQNLHWSEHFLMNSMEPKFQCQLTHEWSSTLEISRTSVSVRFHPCFDHARARITKHDAQVLSWENVKTIHY